MLLAKLQNDLITALKAGETVKLGLIRMMVSAIKYEKINLQRELSDEEIIALLVKEVKKRQDAIELYEKGQRPELAKKERDEIVLIQNYLPKQMSEDEIKKEAEKLFAAISESDRVNFGKVMSIIMPAFKGKADGRLVSNVIKSLVAK